MLGHISFSIRFKSGSSAAMAAALPVREMPTPAMPAVSPRAVGRQRSLGKGRGGSGGDEAAWRWWDPPRRAGRGGGWERGFQTRLVPPRGGQAGEGGGGGLSTGEEKSGLC